MKHFFRITSAMVFMSLLLSIGTAFAQNTDNNGFLYEDEVVEAFKSHLETYEIPPAESEEQKFMDYFFAPYIDEFGLYVIKKRDGSDVSEEEKDEIVQQCLELVKKKRAQYEQQQQQNAPTVSPSDQGNGDAVNGKKNGMPVGLIVVIALVVIVVIVLLLLIFKKKNKKIGTNNTPSSNLDSTDNGNGNNNSANDVIIRRKTTSIMYEQNLDDVNNNGNYMVINCSDFTGDSAVKTMYIKNTCIMDIYNMYAEDLRNPNNPKEDGCMVLGRWVHDEKNDEYAVSLEEVVFPGDDAVFAEYELDFGGKIKVKLNEKLRKLRRETNLQYDLTCWVHSHPGLGVFFSNTDCSLHFLHKHPTHPKFLTAIVIDILTPQQELGVFTFKHDMSINSKADLKQFYSLEEWYKWAVESKRNAVIFEEHFNTLGNAKSRYNECYNIQLSNSAIIDIDLIATNPNRDSLYFAHGFSTQQSGQTTNIAVKIENADTSTDNELMGCFMAVTHRSYPTIKNAVANYLSKIKFVLVYSIADGTLTTIPVVANDLCADESYYGEQSLEDLKIWTRRKR